MTEQQQHLANLLEQRNALKSDLAKLDETTESRRELFFKVQGAIEYLTQIGVELPEPEAEAPTQDQSQNLPLFNGGPPGPTYI